MVKQIQTIEEYYDEDDEIDFYPPSDKDDDEKLVLLACLLILERYFNQLQSMTPQEVLDEIDGLTSSLESDLIETARNKVDNAVWESFVDELTEWKIPVFGYVEQDTSMYRVMDSSITALINQLRDDIKSKAMFFLDNMSNSDFSVVPNFKRAIRRVIDTVRNNLNYSKEKSHGNIMKFVYGEDKLYAWKSAHLATTCDWCLAQEKRPPRRYDDWEMDHPYGHCEKEPIDETYSDEYYLLLADMGELDAPSGDNEYIAKTARRIYDSNF